MANTIAYDPTDTAINQPYAGGATAPTAAQAAYHNSFSGVVTGDNSSTSITFIHNWGLTTAQLTAALPWVMLEPILAAGNTAAAIVTTRNANNVVLTCTAFSGAGLRVRVIKPWSTEQ